MKFKTCAAVMLLLLSQVKLPAQSTNDITPLSVGDNVPDVRLEHLVNYSSGTSVNLSHFNSKLIILDFWSSWCSACISLFPHIDSLQQRFNGDMQVLLVNAKSNISGDNALKITSILQRVKTRTGKAISIPVVYNCAALDEYFPCDIFPHEVWISDGKVIAITSALEVTEANIQSALTGNKLNLHEKKDILNYDTNQPLLSTTAEKENSLIFFRSLITGYVEGIGGSSGLRMKDDKVSGYFSLNSSLFSLAKEAYSNEIVYPDNRIVVESANKYFAVSYNDTAIYHHSYCYDLITPPSDEATIHSYIQNDLKKYFNIDLHKEIRKAKCLVLTRDSSASIITTIDSADIDIEKETVHKYIHGYTPAFIIKLLNRYTTLPIIDDTNSDGLININLPYNLNDVPALQQAFAQSGFQLTREEIPLEVIVISN